MFVCLLRGQRGLSEWWRLEGPAGGGGQLSAGGKPHVSHSGKRRFSDWNWADTGWRKGFPSDSGSHSLGLITLEDTGLCV